VGNSNGLSVPPDQNKLARARQTEAPSMITAWLRPGSVLALFR
jgi:hypothetical protein